LIEDAPRGLQRLGLGEHALIDVNAQRLTEKSLTPPPGQPEQFRQVIRVAAVQDLRQRHRFHDLTETIGESLVDERIHDRNLEVTVRIEMTEPSGFTDQRVAGVDRNDFRHAHDAVAVEPDHLFE
jgi:hypothetical protein